jgi:hypothetical protein
MPKFHFCFLILILFYSCKKDDVQASDTLTSHKWNPYQVRIITFDTTTLVRTDLNGVMHSVTNFYRKDTTYNLDPCIQQLTYSFLQNGISQITDICNPDQSVKDTTWALFPNKILEYLIFNDPVSNAYDSILFADLPANPCQSGDFLMLGTGTIQQMNSSEFVADTKSGETLSATHYVNGLPVDSLVKIVTDNYITFRSQ